MLIDNEVQSLPLSDELEQDVINVIKNGRQKYNSETVQKEENEEIPETSAEIIELNSIRLEKEQACRRAKVNFLKEKEGVWIIADSTLLYHWWAKNANKILNGRVARDVDAYYIWQGKYWTLLRQEDAEKLLADVFQKLFGMDLLSIYFRELWKLVLRKATVPAHKVRYYETVSIPFQNGTLHIFKDGHQFYPDEWFKEDFCRFILDIDYDDSLLNNSWQNSVVGQYMHQYFTPVDRETIQYYLASVLIPDFYLQQGLIILGTGGDGKNILAETVAALFPPQLTSWLPISQWNGGHEMVSLANSILNTSSEVSAREISTDIFKRITAHDMCEINPKFEKPFRVRMIPKHMFILNSNPNLRPDPAVLRRFLFTETIHSVDVTKQTEMFRIRMLEDKKHMAACMIQGIQYHFNSGWNQMTNQNQRLLNSFLEDNEAAVFDFIETMLEITEDPADYISTEDLYQHYQQWRFCHWSSKSGDIIKNTFAKKIGVVFAGLKKNVGNSGKKINNRFVRGYTGIKILAVEPTKNQ